MKPQELQNRLTPEGLRSSLETAMQRAVLLAEAASKQRTPVRTGTLRRSETSRVEAAGRRGVVGTNIRYAPFVHRRIPFFALGLLDAQSAIVAEFQKAGERFFVRVAS